MAQPKQVSPNGDLIASKTEDGFRVYSLQNPANVYFVKKDGDRWMCTCQDFGAHQADTTYRCLHILTVAPWPTRAPVPQPSNGDLAEMPVPAEPSPEPTTRKKRSCKTTNGSAQMLIKRSVSPDGRIDSVSVEFSTGVADLPASEIKDKALATMKIQKEIVGAFLKLNGEPTPEVQNAPAPTPAPAPVKADGKPVFARLTDVGKGKWGDRLCVNVQVNGRWSHLFGTPDQLAAQIGKAGYDSDPRNIEQGLRLNLACLVVTNPSDDGKYLNIERVLPLPKRGSQNASAN